MTIHNEAEVKTWNENPMQFWQNQLHFAIWAASTGSVNRLLSDVSHLLDPYQFAYRAKSGVEDAKLSILNSTYKHLELPESYVRILLADFSSAFNTIQPYILLEKL